MKVIEINTVDYGSTGNIMNGIKSCCINNGIECLTVCGFSEKKDADLILSSKVNYIINYFIGFITGLESRFLFRNTFRIINYIKKEKPDILHLHNIHGNYINYTLLFRYLNKTTIPIVWTFHDCWPFTGRCPYFTYNKCNNWKSGCVQCKYSKCKYPKGLFKRSSKLWNDKKKHFANSNLTIVCPSQWLANLVSESFLRNHSTIVINNGINLQKFFYRASDFRKEHLINDSDYIVLGVAFGWGERKGLDIFIELSKLLPLNFHIVLVGTDDVIDKILPSNIISIHRTQNQIELAEIYSAADLFVNPTREENYPTVNMESIACGTPVLTFRTGGSPEILDETCGNVVDVDDIDSLEKEIIRICETKPYSKEVCLERAKLFDMNDRFKEYIDLYKELSDNQ